jgi:hypothetical protein
LVPTVVVDLGAPLDSPSKREALSSVQVFGGPPESNTESFGQKRSLSEIQTMVRHDLRVNSRFDARVIKHKDQDGSGFLERNITQLLRHQGLRKKDIRPLGRYSWFESMRGSQINLDPKLDRAALEASYAMAIAAG